MLYSSERIKVISLLAMFSIVAWHSFCGSRVEKWLIPLLTHWGVPWFFLVSGVFCRASLQKYSLVDFLKRKIVSLVVPYSLWCVIGVVISYPNLEDASFLGCPDVFAFTSLFPIGNRTLWFLRALLFFFILSVIGRKFVSLIKVRYSIFSDVLFLLCFIFLYMVLTKYLGPLSTPSAPFH